MVIQRLNNIEPMKTIRTGYLRKEIIFMEWQLLLKKPAVECQDVFIYGYVNSYHSLYRYIINVQAREKMKLVLYSGKEFRKEFVHLGKI